MGWDAWLTAGVLVALLGVLASGRLGADIAVLGALLVLLIAGVVSPREAASGFASTGVWTVGLLYVVACGLKETGATAWISAKVLGSPRTALQAQARLVLPVAFLSAVTNNTPLVAAMLPVISGVARRAGIGASRLYMPLSFAAILGGLCTLIGTSTNLVIAGLVEEHNRVTTDPALRVPSFGFLTITPVGVPVALAGLAYILLFGRRLLPDRRDDAPASGADRQYMTAMRVPPGSPVVGRSIESAGLRHLPGLFLSRLERSEATLTAVAPSERLQGGDTLVFVGALESVVDLQKVRGLAPVVDERDLLHDRPKMRLIEAVVSPRSPLIGQTVRDAGIRTRYGAVVVAVHRMGHRLAGKIGDIAIRPGDTLLLEAGPEFARRHRQSNDFTLVSEVEGSAAPRHERAPLALGVLLLVIIGLSGDFIDPLTASLGAAAAMVAGRCCTTPQARASIDWEVLVVIAGSFGLASALTSTGLAGEIARAIVSLGGGSPVVLLALLYACTVLFTVFISNNAAAVLMFPLALGAARAGGLDPMAAMVCVAVGASAEFSTPLGYQTNLMVMGPGGYKWLDFVRFGAPLTVLSGAVALVAASAWFGVPL
ncbi:MAG TPA: SLC13 family permease [Phycisphaerales bacterium]|nr:SLC13 family permease [Phycisphaerales bacterium]